MGNNKSSQLHEPRGSHAIQLFWATNSGHSVTNWADALQRAAVYIFKFFDHRQKRLRELFKLTEQANKKKQLLTFYNNSRDE